MIINTMIMQSNRQIVLGIMQDVCLIIKDIQQNGNNGLRL